MAVGQGSGEPMPHSEGGWLRHIYTGQQGELGATAECPVEAEDHAGGHEQHGSQRLIPKRQLRKLLSKDKRIKEYITPAA